ncbi:MAG: hypothetical protein ACK48W_01570 [Bacteroidota bacterium]
MEIKNDGKKDSSYQHPHKIAPCSRKAPALWFQQTKQKYPKASKLLP